MRYGGVGELEVFKLCRSKGLRAMFAPRFDSKYDLIVESKKVDVKTRCGKVPLNNDFYLNVQASHASADKDVITFCYLNETNGGIQVLGALSIEEFLQKAQLKRKGDRESNGFSYHCDTFVIHPNLLRPIEKVCYVDHSDEMLEDLRLHQGGVHRL